MTFPHDMAEQIGMGMLTHGEAEALHEWARGKFVVELGTWTGASAIVMAQSAAHVLTVDWHGGDDETQMLLGPRDTLPPLRANLRRYGVAHKVSIIVGRFEQVLPFLRDSIADLVYVDGSHVEPHVSHDTMQALRLLKSGGRIVWHDRDRKPVCEAADATGLDVFEVAERLLYAIKG